MLQTQSRKETKMLTLRFTVLKSESTSKGLKRKKLIKTDKHIVQQRCQQNQKMRSNFK